MTEDQDNAGEVVAGAVRVALTAAGQLAEQAARRREADLREAERDSAARVATLQSQLAVERELALRSVRDVVRRGDAATVEEVVHAWEQARSWDDPIMGMERTRLEEGIRERFSVDVSSVSTERSAGQRVTAVAVIERDVKVQAHEAHQRRVRPDRVAQLPADLAVAGVGDEAVTARALAAQSHPTPVTEAARRSRVVPTAKPRGWRRGQSVEVQSPGR